MDWINRLKNELLNVYLDVSVELGHTQITSRELRELKPGDVIVLEEDQSEALLVKAQGLPKFTGRPGKVRESMAVEILGAVDRQLY